MSLAADPLMTENARGSLDDDGDPDYSGFQNLSLPQLFFSLMIDRCVSASGRLNWFEPRQYLFHTELARRPLRLGLLLRIIPSQRWISTPDLNPYYLSPQPSPDFVRLKTRHNTVSVRTP